MIVCNSSAVTVRWPVFAAALTPERGSVADERGSVACKPRGRREDCLVSNIKQKAECNRNRSEDPISKCNVLWLEGKRNFKRQALGQEHLRPGFTCLVCERVLVERDSMAPDGLDEPRKGHFVRIAEREVADAWFGAALSVTRQEIEMMNSLVAARGCFEFDLKRLASSTSHRHSQATG